MFGFRRRRRERRPQPSGPDIHCSFCNKSCRMVLKMIAGPKVQICNECVDICLGILSEDRKDEAPAREPMIIVWCALCRLPIDPEPALLIEGRGPLCPQCVAEIEAALATPSSPPAS
jgi:hypothetical protein